MKKINLFIATSVFVVISICLTSSCSHEEGVFMSLNVNDEYQKIHEHVKSQFDNLRNKIILTRNIKSGYKL